MKKVLAVLAICAIAGCTNKEEQALAGAENFLDAYLANDYIKAAECCTGDLKAELDNVLADFRQLDSNVRALLVSECSQYRAEVGPVERIGDSDTIKVNYRIIKGESDTQVTENVITSSLKVLDGKILKIGE
jgi:hypothetical protein